METTPALDMLRRAKRVGLLFGGGASRCVFHVGIVETLYGLGIEPAACLGVSAGAWNAAAVAAGQWRRLRPYWKFFVRMPYLDLTNLLREHSPFIWSRVHERAFARYVGAERIHAPDTLPIYVTLTRLRDRSQIVVDLRGAADPFRILLASNYLPPFYTHPLEVEGERYGDGSFINNAPYEELFDRGCDAVVLMASKGESEGGLFRNADDYEHVIPPPYADRVVVIRPRHRMPLNFVERRWDNLRAIADLGAFRTREVLLGERHVQTDLAARGLAPSAYFSKARTFLKRSRRTQP